MATSTINNQYSNTHFDMSKIQEDWKYENLTEARKRYVDAVVEHAFTPSGNVVKDITFARSTLATVGTLYKSNADVPNWIVRDEETGRRAAFGVYFIPEVAERYNTLAGTAVDAENVSPGHGTEGDSLADTVHTEKENSDEEWMVMEEPTDDMIANVHAEAKDLFLGDEEDMMSLTTNETEIF